MKILIVHNNTIPVFAYGGTERVVWDLGKALISLGHEVEFMAKKGSTCSFASVVEIDEQRPLLDQVRKQKFDIAHFQFHLDEEPDFPYVVTEHGNTRFPKALPFNTVFLSKNHAERYGANFFVYNGLDWGPYEYGKYSIKKSDYFHFLGHGAWRVKNLKGAIRVARAADVEMEVLGGKRFNLKRGIRLTLSRHIHFRGMVGGTEKIELLGASRGLIFPVRWHEPFGLAVIESLFMGCPVFGTPYGALPELVTPECGYLAPNGSALAKAIIEKTFDPAACHERAREIFNHIRMGKGYLDAYEKVISNQTLNAVRPTLSENGHALIDWSM